MPELPEAETIARDLDTRVQGAVIAGVRVHRPDILAPGLTAARLSRQLRARRIVRVSRRGKNVVFELEGDVRVVVNLGMTGHLITSDAARANEMRHIAVRIRTTDGRAILFDDVRRFGQVDVHDAESWLARDAELGVEPLSDDFTAERLFSLSRSSIVPLRNWLLDQQRIAGVGNIYANEALFRAGIDPSRRTDRLRRDDFARLYRAVREVLEEAIDAKGTTLRDYRTGTGQRGRFQRLIQVYGRSGEQCVRCRTRLATTHAVDGRATTFCWRCQGRSP